MRFLIDAQLPPALARMLAKHDHVAEHVTEIGPGNAPDAQRWRYALDLDAVIVTKDEDFAHHRSSPNRTSRRCQFSADQAARV